ncbi:MAG: hypothetical protein HWN67_20510 [Candidatus Helarchaeota archaeon]|nr:hypothetical protein [Candidatus Helarchaeota archaeon]
MLSWDLSKDREIYSEIAENIDFYFLKGGSREVQSWGELGETKVTFYPVKELTDNLTKIAKQQRSDKKKKDIYNLIKKIYDVDQMIDSEKQKRISDF